MNREKKSNAKILSELKLYKSTVFDLTKIKYSVIGAAVQTTQNDNIDKGIKFSMQKDKVNKTVEVTRTA